LPEHADDFVASLRDAGRSQEYYQLIEARIKKIIAGCGFNRISDISASRVQSFLAELRRNGLGQRTINHYLAAMKQFTKWLVTDRRTNDNRLAHLKGGNPKLDVRRERRELTTDEIRKLLNAARDGKTVYKLTGEQRFRLYATAIGTGFRASELATLTPAHFDLNATPPTVSILAVGPRGVVVSDHRAVADGRPSVAGHMGRKTQRLQDHAARFATRRSALQDR